MDSYDDRKNYCGPDGKFSFSRYIFGVDTNKCYWMHDMRYQCGGNDTSRRFADDCMLHCMVRHICKTYGWYHPLRYAALLQAWWRYVAVRLFGGKYFNKRSY